MNLIFALFWLFVAVTSLVLSWTAPHLRILWINGNIHLGAIALAFFCYNLVRWYTLRNLAERRRHLREAPGRRHFAPGEHRFTDAPPRRTDGGGPDR